MRWSDPPASWQPSYCFPTVAIYSRRDRALLSTKFEFEQLEWRAVNDPKEAYRQHMRYNMERLEAAKFGGLQSPQEMARQGE